MNILLIEPFYTGSHRQWADGLVKYSSHHVQLLTLSGYHWKWRMHGAAVTLAAQANALAAHTKFDLILATDMLDLSVFLSLTRSWSHAVPSAVYFHENQLNYPWSPTDADVKLQRDHHYAFINYASALSAQAVFFNSAYHLQSFIDELPAFLKSFPDYQNLDTVEMIKQKSSVLPLGLDLSSMLSLIPDKPQKPQRACILWNHRWEYDKNPDRFFKALFEIQDRGIDFKLIVLGEELNRQPAIFKEAKEVLSEKILHFGYAATREEYVKWMSMADLLPVTSHQDFFGASIIEAMNCNVVPFLPKRLAYPEHIPAQFHATFFYDEDEFVNKLQRRIMDVKYIRVMNTRQYALRYDWQRLTGEYDKALQQVARA